MTCNYIIPGTINSIKVGIIYFIGSETSNCIITGTIDSNELWTSYFIVIGTANSNKVVTKKDFFITFCIFVIIPLFEEDSQTL